MGGAARWLALTVLVTGALGAGMVIRLADTGDDTVSASAEQGTPTMVVADATGRIFELEEDGTAGPTVAGRDVTGGAVGGLAASPDRSTVWFARHDPLVGLPCDSTLVQLVTATGETRAVAAGFGPAVSPTGDEVAYVATPRASDGSCTYEVAMIDERGNEIQRWPLAPEWAEAFGVCSVAWTPDGQRLVVEVCVENDAVLHAVAAGEPGTIGDTTFLGPARADRSLTVPATGAAPGEVLAIEYELDRSLEPTGATLVSLGATFGGERHARHSFDSAASIMAMDTDPSGERVVYVELVPQPDGPPTWQLHRWDGAEPVLLHEGVVAARW